LGFVNHDDKPASRQLMGPEPRQNKLLWTNLIF
jgi:hypothetical protein